MRLCTGCNSLKPADQFRYEPSRKRLRWSCKSCDTTRHREWRQKNREKLRAYDRSRYVTADRWPSHLRRKYQITPDEFESLFESQSRCCAICKTKEPGGRAKRFNVDHCHKTGVVRGLLCMNCNRMLGHARDNADFLLAGAKYLSLPSRRKRSSKPISNADA